MSQHYGIIIYLPSQVGGDPLQIPLLAQVRDCEPDNV